MSTRTDYTVPPKITQSDWNRIAAKIKVYDEGFVAKEPVIITSRPSGLFAPPWWGCPIAYSTPYKAEQYNYSTGTWSDITGSYTWKYLTDFKRTYVDSGIKSPDGSETPWRIRLYYDLGGGFWSIHGIVVVLQHTSYVKEVVVEASSYSDFSADIVTLISWSGSTYAWNGVFFLPCETSIGNRRYVRIWLTLSTTSTVSTIKLWGLWLVNLVPPGVQPESILPFTYDSDKNITFVNNAYFSASAPEVRPTADNRGSVGTSSYRWSLVRAVTITSGDLVFARSLGQVEEKVQIGVDEKGNPIYEEVTKSVGDEELFRFTEEQDPTSGAWKLALKASRKNERIMEIDEEKGRLRVKGGAVMADVVFAPEDRTCPICGKSFEVGDSIILKVIAVEDDGYFRAKPVHVSCAGGE